MAHWQSWAIRLLCLLGTLVGAAVAARVTSVDANDLARLRRDAQFVVAVCEPCKELQPELQTAAIGLEYWGVRVVTIDCAEHEQLCTSHDVASYPAIRIFEGEKETRHRGSFKASGIMTAGIRKASSSPIIVTKDNFNILMSLDLPLILTTEFKYETLLKDIVDSLAENLKQSYFVGIARRPPMQRDKEDPVAFTVFNRLDEVKPTYTGPLTEGKVLAWAKKVSTPLIGKLDLSSFAGFMKTGDPLAIIVSDQAAERAVIAESLKDIAFEFKGKVNFATLDAARFPFLLEPLGLETGKYPAFSIQTDQDSYPMEHGTEITRETVQRLIVRASARPPEKEL
ncbi:hypothetical protein BX600DRAFT_444852 [Xylariales sp. PMI_506]|nr:hypothetical protein BX600DRAFT_444852 [Xylariales sp. PMI_506]